MGSFFKQPEAPQEDPETKALRDQEQARAEADRISSIQEQLGVETRLRNRRFGIRSLLGPLGNQQTRSLLGSG